MGFSDDYADTNMTGIPGAWWRNVPVKVQDRIRQVDDRLRIIRVPRPPHLHFCVMRVDPNVRVSTTCGTLKGWHVVESNIRGGLDGVEAFVAMARKNNADWERRGGDDKDKQWASRQAELRADKARRDAEDQAEWDALEGEFLDAVGTQKSVAIINGSRDMGSE